MLMLLLILLQIAPPADPATQYIKPLIACFEGEGWEVKFLPMPQGYEDTYVAGDRETMRVVVNERLDNLSRLASLAYQMAYNHGPEGLGQRDRDLWSELVSHQVLVALDLPTEDSLEYMKRFDRVEDFALAEAERTKSEATKILRCVGRR